MTEFLVHFRRCQVCQPRLLCDDGWKLLNECAYSLARRLDPKRAKA